MNEGKCARLYGWFFDSYVSKCKDAVYGHFMLDKMKLKNDIYWNCSNIKMFGLAASNDGTDKLGEDEISSLLNFDEKYLLNFGETASEKNE